MPIAKPSDTRLSGTAHLSEKNSSPLARWGEGDHRLCEGQARGRSTGSIRYFLQRSIRYAFWVLLIFFCLRTAVNGQTQNLTFDSGAMGLFQALQRLPRTSRLMFIAAHPDDEPGGVLTYVSRGLHSRTALLTLTRGEGGQNLIGAALFDALGLLRTGELVAAGEYYGVQQFFTRAFDFGFSKSPVETFQMWGKETILNDMVRAIRAFRPEVIVSVWQGTSADGHGHHQASGILAREAFQLSGDPTAFPQHLHEGLPAWQARKFYVGNLDEKEPASFAVNTGEYLPLLGASFQQIGIQGYSLHRSQGLGNSYAPPGSHLIRYRLVIPETARDAGFFDGLNQDLLGTPRLLDQNDPLRSRLEQQFHELDGLVQEAQHRFVPDDFTKTCEALLKGLAKLREIRSKLGSESLRSLPGDHLQFLIQEKEQDFLTALRLATGLSFEVLADDDLITPGQVVTITASVVNRSSVVVHPQQVQIQSTEDWKVDRLEGSLKPLGRNEQVSLKFRVSVPQTIGTTRPAWRRNSKRDAIYAISEKRLINAPLMPPVLRAKLDYTINGTHLNMEKPVEFLDSDRLKGTRHVSVLVVPHLTLEVTPPLQLIPLTSSAQSRSVQVKLVNNSKSQATGKVFVKTPAGWKAQPEEQAFSLSQEAQAITFNFKVAGSGAIKAGRASFQVIAKTDEAQFDLTYQMATVFDLWRFPLYRQAASEVLALDLKLPENLSVGYIMGTGDRVPQTLSQLGMRVKLLEDQDLAGGDLAQYQCIIAGVRAYDVRGDLIANNARLLEYVRTGGVYIIQYNTPAAWNERQYAPYAAKIQDSNHRVADEAAPVAILDPQHPVFNLPNKITNKDFEDWVQERGLYFIQQRDSRFTPLLASSDPGEAPLDGGMLIAEDGKGSYVLTSFSWFRQLPEGVPGAIRVFVNLVSLGTRRR